LEEVRKTQQLMHKPTMYDGQCRELSHEEVAKRVTAGDSHVIRLKLPREGKVTVQDAIRGSVEFEWALIDDQVIVKSDGFPTYHLAAMCDDHDMDISHVIRGEEWLSSTPKHVFIYQAFGWELPVFAHLPLLLNPDRSKLSKRQGDVAAHDYLEKGYLPEAILNFVALLGWNPTGDRELYAHEELIKAFDLHKINKAGAVFNVEKLDWMNGQYLRSMPETRYLELTKPHVQGSETDQMFIGRCLLLVRDRLVKPQDAGEATASILRTPSYANVALTWKTQPKEEALQRLMTVREAVATWDDAVFDKAMKEAMSEIETTLRALVTEKGWGNGDTFWPLRVALSGEERSPSPFELLWVLGKQRSLERIDAAIAYLQRT
jgi:glutamyl-tRNA synthetase